MVDSSHIANIKSTGGIGVVFEQHVGAAFLAYLLTKACLPVHPSNSIPIRVHFQAKRLGWNVDDLVIEAADFSGVQRRLAAQVKLSFTVSNRDKNCIKTFVAAWMDFNNSKLFNKKDDALLLITHLGTNRLLGDFGTLLTQARASSTAENFEERRSGDGMLNNRSKDDYDAIKNILEVSTRSSIPNADLWVFLRAFYVLSYDFPSASAKDEALIKSLLSSAKTDGSPFDSASPTWNELIVIASKAASDGKSYSRDDLPVDLQKRYREAQMPQHVTAQRVQEFALIPFSEISNFRSWYLGTPDHPVPFGGRNEALGDLDAWLNVETSPPYLILTAPAGRGKSSLLVHWSEALLCREDLEVIFYPVSVRYQTNLAINVFRSLAMRLAKIHGETVAHSPNATASFWKQLVAEYLKRPAPTGLQVLLIVDGLDEASDWVAGPHLFPVNAAPGIRILLSARTLAIERGAGDWARRLGWNQRLARSLDLEPLTSEGITETLAMMGCPLDLPGTPVNIAEELHHLSGGDPLLVGLYVEALWECPPEKISRLRLDELQAIKPGLEGYFERWWEDQRKLWGDKDATEQPAVEEFLNLLSCALGPLSRDDLLRLSPKKLKLTSRKLDRALVHLRRFIIGNGLEQPFTFGHPRLADYFFGQLAEFEQKEVEQRFLNWGETTLRALNAEADAPSKASNYIIHHYGTHLLRAQAPIVSMTGLVTGGWQRGWFRLEHTNSGFLTDVHRAWDAVNTANAQAARNGHPVPLLRTEICCALCQASTKSQSGKLPAHLVARFLEEGLWTRTQGLAYAEQLPESQQRLEILIALLPHLLTTERYQIADNALAAIENIADQYFRCMALEGLAPHLQTDDQLESAFALAKSLQINWRAEAIAALALKLPEADQYRNQEMALACTQSLDEFSCAWALSKLGRYLSVASLEKAISIVENIRSEIDRAIALVGLARHLPPSLLEIAFTVAKNIGDAEPRARAMTALAEFLPQNARQRALEEALAAVKKTKESNSDELLRDLAPHLPMPLLKEACAIARELENDRYRAKALATLAPYLPDATDAQIFESAFMAAKHIRHENVRNIIRTAEKLSKTDRHQILVTALSKTLHIQERAHRNEVLTELAPHLPITVLNTALFEMQSINDKEAHAIALVALSPHLPESNRPQALSSALVIAKDIENEWSRAKVLASLASFCSAPYSEILATAQNIRDEWPRAKVLSALARYLPVTSLDAVLAATMCIKSDWPRAHILSVLIPRLPEVDRLQPLEDALDAMRRINEVDALRGHGPVVIDKRHIEDKRTHDKIFNALAPFLSEGQKEIALVIAISIEDESSRTNALAGLAKYLSEPLFNRAFCAVKDIRNESDRSKALSVLLISLPPSLLKKSFFTTMRLMQEYDRVETLIALAPKLNGAQRKTALTLANGIETEWLRVKTLSAFIPLLPKSARKQSLESALVTANGINDNWARVMALSVLAPFLPETTRHPILESALATAKDIQHDSDRARSLITLLPHLSKTMHRQVSIITFNAAKNCRDTTKRNKLLADLALHLSPPLIEDLFEADDETRQSILAIVIAKPVSALPARILKRLLETSMEISEDKQRAEALTALGVPFAALSPTELYPIWRSFLKFSATKGRDRLLRDLATLAPIIAKLGGKVAAVETVHVIQDVGQWWE